MSDFYPLTISNITQLTPNAVALSFTVPTELEKQFAFTAGQYITLEHKINGENVRRAYSISSSPSSGELTVGIKKMPDGTFSVYANESLKQGDTMRVMPPEGRFVFQPTSEKKIIGAFASGSGITPIMSIAETVLAQNENSSFVLVYGNQNLEEAMYRERILELQNKYTDRFFVQWVYSRSSEPDCLFGRIEASTVNLIIKNKFKHLNFDAFYLCGPEAMIQTVSDTLKTNSFDGNSIFFELFTATENEDTIAQDLEGKTALEVVVDDETFTLTMDKKDYVLDAVLKEDIDAPYSCQGGVCSSCIARVTQGKAEMAKNQILTDSEVEEGLILTCQAHALTPVLKIDYDDV